MSPTLDQLFRWRIGGRVQRYHTHGLIRPPTVDQHQWGVAVIALYLNPDLSREGLIKALVHDLAEFETGDIPAFVKRVHPDLRHTLRAIESSVEDRIGTKVDVDVFTERQLKLADLFDHISTCLDEAERGNFGTPISMFFRGVLQIGRYIEDYFTEGSMMYAVGNRARDLLWAMEMHFAERLGEEKFKAFKERVAAGQDFFLEQGDTAEVPKEDDR